MDLGKRSSPNDDIEMRVSVRRGVNRSSRVGQLPKSLAVLQYAVSQFAVCRSQLSQSEVAVAESETLSQTKYSGVYADVTRHALRNFS